MVVTSPPCASSAKIKQESAVLPSSSTVQAPPSPSLQPSLVPVRCSSSRSSCSNDWRGSMATSYGVPFTVNVIRRFTSLSCVCGPRHVLLEHLQHTQGRLHTALAQHFHHVFAIRRRTAHVGDRAGFLSRYSAGLSNQRRAGLLTAQDGFRPRRPQRGRSYGSEADAHLTTDAIVGLHPG